MHQITGSRHTKRLCTFWLTVEIVPEAKRVLTVDVPRSHWQLLCSMVPVVSTTGAHMGGCKRGSAYQVS